MNINCANCGSSYALTLDQIAQVPNSVILCIKCERRIKIAQCPNCKVFYSVTYSSVKNSAYRLTCEKCKSKFVLTFNEHQFEQDNAVTGHHQNPDASKNNIDGMSSNIKKNSDQDKKSNNFTVGYLLETFRLAFIKKNFWVSFIGLSIIIVISALQYFLFGSKIILIEKKSSIGIIAKIVNGVPIAIILYLYMIVSAIIAWNYKNYKEKNIFPLKDVTAVIIRITPLLLICNCMVLLIINSLLYLFIKIPTIGPLFFALLFFPIYVLSIVIILLALVGFWFVPPIAVNGDYKFSKSLRRMHQFVIKQKYSLIFVVPILFLVLSLFFAIIYSLHLGAYSIVCYIGKSYAPDEFMQSFASVPSVFIRITEFIFLFSDGGYIHFESVPSAFTDIGGMILGGILVLIAMIFYSILLSLTSILAVRTYILFESGEDISDVSIIRLLSILLIVSCLFIIIKKFILM